MALSIAALLGGDPPDDDDLELPDRIDPAVADSIFAALGVPENPVRVVGFEDGQYGRFTKDREILLSHDVRGDEMYETLAHELSHQAVTRRDMDPAVGQVMMDFYNEWRALDEGDQRGILREEYGVKNAPNPSELSHSSPILAELLAETFEEGYRGARQGRSEPKRGLPGVQSAINFFMNAFRGMNPNAP